MKLEQPVIDDAFDEKNSLVHYFHFNNPSKSQLHDYAQGKSRDEQVEYLKKLDEADPIEHSDKWGSRTQPYSVKATISLTDFKPDEMILEFWTYRSFKINEYSYQCPEDEWTHFSFQSQQVYVAFLPDKKLKPLSQSTLLLEFKEVTEIRVWKCAKMEVSQIKQLALQPLEQATK